MKIIDRIISAFQEKTPRALPHALEQGYESQAVNKTDFRFDLLRLLWKSHPGENICLSPFSIASTLAVLFGGAGGETKRTIARAMRLEDISPTALDLRYKGLLGSWKTVSAGSSMRLNIASSLWTGRRFPIRNEFARRVKEIYGAETGELDFAGSSARSVKVINNWVNKKTRRRIPSIIEHISSETRLVLANAIYFKGFWSEIAKFDPGRTKKERFHLLDGSQKQVQMMRRSEEHELAYCRGHGFQAVILPYKNSSFQMVLFLPDEHTGLSEFLQSLTAENWGRWISRFEPAPGEILLPRFKLNCIYMLNEALISLGMGVAFSEQADFNAISHRLVWIDRVLHGSSLDVDEMGTEAAAATVALQTLGIHITPLDQFSMIFDHPFFCAVHDSKTDEILFTAAVVDPEPSSEQSTPNSG